VFEQAAEKMKRIVSKNALSGIAATIVAIALPAQIISNYLNGSNRNGTNGGGKNHLYLGIYPSLPFDKLRTDDLVVQLLTGPRSKRKHAWWGIQGTSARQA